MALSGWKVLVHQGSLSNLFLTNAVSQTCNITEGTKWRWTWWNSKRFSSDYRFGIKPGCNRVWICWNPQCFQCHFKISLGAIDRFSQCSSTKESETSWLVNGSKVHFYKWAGISNGSSHWKVVTLCESQTEVRSSVKIVLLEFMVNEPALFSV